MIYEFSPFRLDTDRAELSGPAGHVALEPKAFALLTLLVENHHRVISKDEMIATVWSGRFISDDAVSTALKLVRKAVNDDGTAQSFVRVDLSDTRSGSVIWSERIERPLDDVHEIRVLIVAAVLSALDLRIPLAEAELARTRAVENLDAWGLYHPGLSHMYRFNGHDNAIAGGLFRRATTLDANFAAAFAALSFTSYQDAAMGFADDRAAAVADARATAERAIELDPLDPSANSAIGRLHILRSRPRRADGQRHVRRKHRHHLSCRRWHGHRGDRGRTHHGTLRDRRRH